ncbi:MAG: hypothetical protein GKS06_16785 [Acidobacteria bacterium]|nr:hypothetical protein [Acidobacteriota bacterium]
MKELLGRLDSGDYSLVLRCGEIAAQRGYTPYLVGGVVRDLVLDTPSPDIDIVVDGDAIVVAQDVARALGGEVLRHHAFQTATVTLTDGRRVDFATARSETYPKRGALPSVAEGNIEEDLARRDFTINTMAIAIAPAAVGALVDPHGGREDLAARQIRFLHEQSFSDDPTRLLRALRFALRLDYEIETRTSAGIRVAAQGGFLGDISGDRMRRELEKLLREQPVHGPKALREWQLLDDIFVGLEVDLDALRLLSGREEDVAWQVLAVMAVSLAPQERWELGRRLRLPGAAQDIVVDSGVAWDRARAALSRLALDAPRSAIASALDPLSEAVLEVGSATWPEGRDRVLLYIREDRGVTSELDGNDLLEIGAPSGRSIGAMLQTLRYARIDGAISDRAGEERLVRTMLDGPN